MGFSFSSPLADVDRGGQASAAVCGLPLCVDCDGTLISTDLLHEAALLALHASPVRAAMRMLGALRSGKAAFKREVAALVEPDFATLPYRPEVIALIQRARAQGRHVVLATAAHVDFARGVADHLRLFDDVIATGDVNLSGRRKADALVARFGDRGFDYVGDSSADLAVWAHARSAIVVTTSARFKRAVGRVTSIESTIQPAAANAVVWMRALRLHQWLKNLLVFVPMLAGQQLLSPTAALASLGAFLAFGMTASVVYVINDLLDLRSDRLHVRKRLRPFATGRISATAALTAAALLLVLAATLATALPPLFGIALASYLALTTAYSVRLKRQVVVDVLILAGLYTLRVLAGSAATSIVPSFWLLAFSMFLFLSLALIKRYSELQDLSRTNRTTIVGRGYALQDLPVLLALGTASGMNAVLVVALYIHAPETASMYENAYVLWLAPPMLLYWISRLWLKAHRGEVHDDPVVFAARDWQSLVLAAALTAVVVFASFPS